MPRRETSRGFSSSTAGTTAVSNTTAETTVFSEVIPANKMGTSKKLTMNILATLTTPALSIPSFTVRVKLGTATMTVANNLGLAASTTNSPFTIETRIRNKDATNVQIAYAKMMQNATNQPMLIANSSAAYGDWAIDTTVHQTLSVTVQFGGLSGTTSFTLRDVDLDLS